jgi:hypothetical protein
MQYLVYYGVLRAVECCSTVDGTVQNKRAERASVEMEGVR